VTHRLPPVADPTETDKDGRIGAKELGEIIRSRGQDPTEDEIKASIGKVEIVGDGTIDFVEFMQIMTARINDNFSDEELRHAFTAMDKDGSGTVSADELKAVMLELGRCSMYHFAAVCLRTSHNAQMIN
jgi:calmodulin